MDVIVTSFALHVNSMKKIILFASLLGLGIFFFVVTINNIGIGTIIDSISQFRLSAFILFFLVSYINFIIYTFRWKVLINVGGKDVPLMRLILHSFGGFMMSYLTPATLLSGEPVRIYLLKKADNIPVHEGTFSVITDKALEMTTVLIFILISIMLALSKGLIGKDNMYSLIATVIVTALLLGLFYWLTISGRGFFRTIFRLLRFHTIKKFQPFEEKIINTETKIFHFFIDHKQVFIFTLLLAALCWFIKIFENYIILYFLGITPTFTEMFVLTFLPMIALLMPIPGGFGILEGGTAAIMGVMGIDARLAVSLVLISRIRDLIFVSIGLVHTSHYSIKSILHNLKNISTMNGKEAEK